VILGGVVSTTFTVKLQLPTFAGEASSLSEQVTVLLPRANDEPEMGEHPFEVTIPGQLSVPKVASANVALALLDPVHSVVTFAGQVIERHQPITVGRTVQGAVEQGFENG